MYLNYSYYLYCKLLLHKYVDHLLFLGFHSHNILVLNIGILYNLRDFLKKYKLNYELPISQMVNSHQLMNTAKKLREDKYRKKIVLN